MDNISIVLVSENKDKASIVRESLLAMDIHSVRVVYNYTSALDLLKQKSAAMILVEMDIQKDAMTAVEFVATLRKDMLHFAHVHEAPIILLAGDVSRADVEVARDSGVTEFVVYPFSVAYLRTVIKSVINNPRKFIISKDFFGPDRRRKRDGNFKGEDRRRQRDDD